MQETWVRSLGWEDPLEIPSPVFWPGEFHGPYNPWGHKELDMTEQLSTHSNGDVEIENRLVDTVGEGKGGIN